MWGKTSKTRLRAATAVVALLAASGAQAMSLNEAFATAYETNPSLIAARANLAAIDETVNQARAGLRPSVGAEVRIDGTYTDSEAFGENRSTPFSAGLTATQPIYDGGATYNATRGRIADVSAARSRLEQLEQTTLLDVVIAYFDVLRDAAFVDLGRNNVRVISEQLRAARDRFEVGEVTRTDVSQAEARLAASQANLTTAIGDLERSQQDFRAVVGAEPQSLTRRPPLPVLPASEEEAVAIALESHPLILAARFEEASARRDVKTEIGGLLPEVDVVASLNYSDSTISTIDLDSNDTGSASIGVRARIPLYQGGAQYSRVRQAQALASEARAEISVQARERRRLVESAWTELKRARANIRSQREQVQAAQLAFEGVREEAIVGSRTTLDVLDSEQELLDARAELVASERDESVAAYGLLSTIGRLTMASLDIATVAYDPQISYDENNARFFGYERTDDTQWEALWRP